MYALRRVYATAINFPCIITMYKCRVDRASSHLTSLYMPQCLYKIARGSTLPPRDREGVQGRHDPRKNYLRGSGFAELPPGPAKLVF